jgi:hypothetical protein
LAATKTRLAYQSDLAKAIENADLEENFMSHLEEIFFMNDSEIPTITELNDYIRFETDTIFECLGLNEDGELEEEV